MKAVIQEKYGPPAVLKVTEVEKPVPKEDEVLIKIYATSVTQAHIAMRKGKPLFGRLIIGLTKPKNSIPGTDLAGEIESVGREVKNFQLGNKVFAATDADGGAYAEFICLKENDVILEKPENMSYEEASGIIEGATTSLAFLRDHGKVKAGQKVLVNGASGSVGSAAVQLAKYYGAKVTGVCSTKNVEMVISLGADEVIDYTKDDFTKNENSYDIIFDTVGKSSFSKSKDALKDDGIFLSPVLSFSILSQMIKTKMIGKKKVIFAATGLRKPEEKIKDLKFLKGLIDEGRLKSIIDRKYKLDDIVEAHKYVEKGHKSGNVILQINED